VIQESHDFFRQFRVLGSRRWRVTGGAALGRRGLRPSGAGRLLPHALVGAVVIDLAATTRPRQLPIARGTARHATDPLRRSGARRRGVPAAALGASLARDHAHSVTGAVEEVPSKPSRR
jgi:hypothetical protein